MSTEGQARYTLRMFDFLNITPAYFLAGILVISSSAIYGFRYLHREISLARSIWKTLPALVMAGIAIYFNTAPLLPAAMLLCALGDYFLSRGQARFIPGLLAFLAGHIVYIVVFSTLSTGVTFYWPMLLIALYSGVFIAYMWRTAGGHRWPVVAYIVVITVMAVVSLSLPAAYFLTVIGVFVFVFSDSVLAIRMFVVDDPRLKLVMSWAVWASYIVGQSLILIGLVATT